MTEMTTETRTPVCNDDSGLGMGLFATFTAACLIVTGAVATLPDRRVVGARVCVWCPRAFYRGLRLMSLDGTCVDVADTTANDEAFGRPGSSRREGGGAFPQLRVVGLAESGTHAICSAALGPCTRSEQELLDTQLIGSLTDGMLCLADRNFYRIG